MPVIYNKLKKGIKEKTSKNSKSWDRNVKVSNCGIRNICIFKNNLSLKGFEPLVITLWILGFTIKLQAYIWR